MSLRKNFFLNTSRLTIVSASIGMLIALLALLGWIFNVEFFKTFNSDWPSIKVNSALGIIFSGIALFLFIEGKKGLALGFALLVFLLGIITLSEHIFQYNAHIDELLFLDRGTKLENNHGRMAQFTSIAFTLIGISLVAYPSKRKWIQNLSQISVFLVLILAFTAFIGVLYNAGRSFRVANIASFSIPTALSGLLMCIGILFSKPPSGILLVFDKQTAATKALLKGSFISVIILIVIGWLCLEGISAGVFDYGMGAVIMITTFTVCFLLIALSGIRRLNKSEDLLITSEKNLRHVLSSSADVFYVIDRNYNIKLINEKAKRDLTKAWGKPVTEGANILELIPKNSDESIQENFEKVFKGNSIEYEIRVGIKDLPSWVLVTYTPVRDDSGNIIGSYVITKDISERKKAEEELRQSNNRFELISKATNDAIWEWDLETGQLWSNETHQQLYGLSMADPVPDVNTWTERIHPDDRQNILDKQDASLTSTRNVFISEYRFKVDGKGYRNIYDRCYIVRNKEGKAIRMMGSMMDFTELKKIEEELRISEQRYRSLIEQASDYIMITDTKGNFTDVNSSLCKAFGYGREELLTMNISDIIDPIQLKADPIRFDLLAGGKAVLRERRMMNKDGTLIEVEANVKMLPDGRVLSIARNIEERKKAEIELRKSEETRRLIMDSALDAIVGMDTNGSITVWTPQAEKIFGWEEKEIIGKTIVDTIIPAQYRERHKDGFKRYLQTRQAVVLNKLMELSALHRNGKEFPIEISIVPVKQGETEFFCAFIRDITERKKAEEALAESENRLRTIVKAEPECVKLLNFNCELEDMNPAGLRMVEADKLDDVKGKSVLGIINEGYRKEFEELTHNIFKGKSGTFEFEIRGLKGTRRWLETHAVPLKDTEGKIIFALGVTRDITERKKAQQLVIKEKELSDSIINSMPGVFYLFDEREKYIRWNRFKEIITGYSHDEIKKMSPLDFFEGKEKDYVRKHIEECFRTGETNVEASLVTKDGRKIPFFFTGIAIQYEDKRCLLGTGINISDRKKAEQEVQQSYIAIRQLTEHLQNIREEERTHIAREIHDELGQQLTVLKMDASWLNKKLSSADESVKQKLKDLLELLDGTVRTVRKISSELRPSLLDDMGLVAAMEWHLKEFEKRAAIKTRFTIPQNDLALSDTIKTGLFRIFQESLTNVARHANAKKVEVKLQQQNGNLILSIKDDGKGFDKEKAAHKKTLGILGMEERSFMMGGNYQINSKPGEGTLVVVSVPHRNN